MHRRVMFVNRTTYVLVLTFELLKLSSQLSEHDQFCLC